MFKRQKKQREPRNKRVRAAIAAVALAAVGATGLVAFVKGAEERALAGEKVVEVLVVKARIGAGTPAEELAASLRRERVPAKTRAEGAVAELAGLEGYVAEVDLLPGEQITTQRFVAAEEFGRTGGRVEVPDGLLEVTVSLAPERAVGGAIRPGSRVAVTASFESLDDGGANAVDGTPAPGAKAPVATHVILHKVLVTNVQSTTSFDVGVGGGDDKGETAPAPSDDLLVTLALDAPSVERVVFAAEHGTLWLAFEPADAAEGGTRVQSRGTVYQ